MFSEYLRIKLLFSKLFIFLKRLFMAISNLDIQEEIPFASLKC
jgi:hypothetical protein